MAEFEREMQSKVEKESIKALLKQQLSSPSDSLAKRQEIDCRVELSAQYADFIVDLARYGNVDIAQVVFLMFGLGR